MARLLKFLGLASSTYYYRRSKPVRPDRYAEARPALREEFANAYRAYGYRRMRVVLRTRHGLRISGKTVRRLMREEGCVCPVRRRRYRSYRGQIGRIAPNVLERDFTASAPAQKWATDVTEFTVAGQKLYLSPVIDLFNGEIITYTLRSSPTLQLVTDMLATALKNHPMAKQTVIHSDQGWHYQHRAYRRLVDERGLTQSMSRKGNCLDNAKAESFFSHLKQEFIRPGRFSTVNEFKGKLAGYMHWYNHERIKETLGGLSPVQYRTQASQQAPR
ncbi:IS3 family transposase [Sinomonas sp. G460-2]|uniref:IS3 family transposase n=1 Tax=Sinomonas sp. G460-2 TaxID=3393464 RepID=UPI0039F080DD